MTFFELVGKTVSLLISPYQLFTLTNPFFWAPCLAVIVLTIRFLVRPPARAAAPPGRGAVPWLLLLAGPLVMLMWAAVFQSHGYPSDWHLFIGRDWRVGGVSVVYLAEVVGVGVLIQTQRQRLLRASLAGLGAIWVSFITWVAVT